MESARGNTGRGRCAKHAWGRAGCRAIEGPGGGANLASMVMVVFLFLMQNNFLPIDCSNPFHFLYAAQFAFRHIYRRQKKKKSKTARTAAAVAKTHPKNNNNSFQPRDRTTFQLGPKPAPLRFALANSVHTVFPTNKLFRHSSLHCGVE